MISTMNQVLFNFDEVKKKIEQGKILILAGDEDVLKNLPKGNWIGGTIPYFMAEKGGISTREQIFVTEFPGYITDFLIKEYDENSISKVFVDHEAQGFSIIIIPASCPLHFSYALNSYKYEGFATRQLIGWIAGMHLDDLGTITPKVFNGKKGEMLENAAVVIHVALPESKYSDIDIINIFEQGEGDVIVFPEDGFSATDAIINGEKKNFAEYIKEHDLDIRFPLVADYSGAMINTSFQNVDEENRKVDFYAPVFKGVEYKQAKPVEDYVSKFLNNMPKESSSDNIIFSCNCILNYLYSELEGKHTGGMMGPMTFGEIAYQLLNQTLVYLKIMDF